MTELVYKKKDGFYFCLNDFSREENIPYQVLLLDKKATYKKGIDYAIAHGINQIEVVLDLSEEELALLKNIPLKGLEIKGIQSKVNITFLNELETLEYFHTNSQVYGEIDFCRLKNLTYLSYDATNLSIVNIEKADKLKELYIFNYKESNLAPFGNIKIEKFLINHSFITNLNALSECQSLKSVTVENSRYLSSIEGINSSVDNLEELALRNCKSFSNYSILYKLHNLKDLYLLNCGTMQDTSFFSNLNSLKYGYIDINILDGNVDLLMQMPIIFKNLKHYNRKNNLKIKIVTNDGNYLVRGKDVLYKL